MNKDEYVIINKSKLLKRIEELEEEQKQINEEKEPISLNINLKKQILIREILSQSTPLIPEVEKLIVMSSISNIDFLPDRVEKIKQDYISNLKLNI
ncbi:MAG TPA: hypothetical protein PLH46_01175 [Caldisericia bacterium]|nr:hypothetical protein [Caldisericia bacterium]